MKKLLLSITASILLLFSLTSCATTPARDPLDKGSVNETGYYTDTLNWIRNGSTLENGMKQFYKKTGVQPYLYITDTLPDNAEYSIENISGYCSTLYDQLFTDEAHYLLLMFERSGKYTTWYVCGTQAKQVIDTEAANIILDYVDRYYYYTDMSEEQMFSKVFSDSATDIMYAEVSGNAVLIVLIGALACIVIVIVLVVFLKKRKEQRIEELRHANEILNTPIELLSGDSEELDRLASKYDVDGVRAKKSRHE